MGFRDVGDFWSRTQFISVSSILARTFVSFFLIFMRLSVQNHAPFQSVELRMSSKKLQVAVAGLGRMGRRTPVIDGLGF